ncbi:MAG: ATP-binding protein [Bacillota bacterium]|nr:ATP-binding protein [Bacillota bacterium]
MTILIYLISASVLIILLRVIKKLAEKTILQKICSLNVILVFLWTFFKLLNFLVFVIFGKTNFEIFFLASASAFFLPSTLVLLSILFIKKQIDYLRTYVVIFIPPVISTLLLATNNLHKLFLKQYDAGDNSMVFGPLYYLHCTWQLAFSCFAVWYIVYYSLKYTNGLSKQILLVILSILSPVLVDLLIYLNYFSALPISIYKNISVISYCISAIFLTSAIYRYRFLDTVPIAIRSIIDNISDSFVVVDRKFNILEINNVLKKDFDTFLKSDGKTLSIMFGQEIFEDFLELVTEYVDHTRQTGKMDKFEYKLSAEDTVKYYNIEVSPIFIKKKYMATLILFKNISDHIQVLKLTEENTKQLVEKARLISLNQLIGGIAHNIKSPLMSSSGGVLALEGHTKKLQELLKKYELLTGYPECDTIIKEMQNWEARIKQYLVYISDVITAVKDQAVSLNSKENRVFTIKTLLDKVNILMEFELKRSGSTLEQIINVDTTTEIEGDITALTQIVNNIVLNAIQSYQHGGVIELKADKLQDYVIFTIRDFGKGINKEIRDKIFNEMITTKGKDGTGLGLYIANIAVKGQFRGEINIDSEPGKGTSVSIRIPEIKNSYKNQQIIS